MAIDSWQEFVASVTPAGNLERLAWGHVYWAPIDKVRDVLHIEGVRWLSRVCTWGTFSTWRVWGDWAESAGEGRSPRGGCEVTEQSLQVKDVLHVEHVRWQENLCLRDVLHTEGVRWLSRVCGWGTFSTWRVWGDWAESVGAGRSSHGCVNGDWGVNEHLVLNKYLDVSQAGDDSEMC